MYCALSDIRSTLSEAEIARLTDDTNGKIVNEDIVNESISKSDELINGYLRGRYTIPLDIVPDLVKNLSVDLALYYLYQRRFRTKMPESIETQYRATIKTLEQIQRGYINLGIEPQSIEGGQAGIYRCNKTSSSKMFNNDILSRY